MTDPSPSPDTVTLELVVNDQPVRMAVAPTTLLVELLRGPLGLMPAPPWALPQP
jgi:hypothetical protein